MQWVCRKIVGSLVEYGATPILNGRILCTPHTAKDVKEDVDEDGIVAGGFVMFFANKPARDAWKFCLTIW